MPRKFLSLPEDILAEILEKMMPSLSPDYWTTRTKLGTVETMPVPKDLCRLAVVCRVLHRLALPRVWRRVAINLRDDLSSSSDKLSHTAVQWQYLCTHPELVTYTRSLSLEVDERRTHLSALALGRLARVIFFVGNLRILRAITSLESARTRETFETIYPQLLGKSHLRMIIIMPGYPLVIPSFHPNIHLTHLNISGWRGNHECLLRAAPLLESLVIERFRNDNNNVSSLQSLLLPWATLRRVELKWFNDWYKVLINLSSWKQSNPTSTPSLSDFIVHTAAQMKTSEIDILTSSGLDLRVLSLSDLPMCNHSRLAQITSAFPRLKHLGRFSIRRWDMDPSPYLGNDYPHFVEMIASSCPGLESLVFDHVIVEHVIFNHVAVKWCLYTINRDGTGEYESFSREVIDDLEPPHPKSWGIHSSETSY